MASHAEEVSKMRSRCIVLMIVFVIIFLGVMFFQLSYSGGSSKPSLSNDHTGVKEHTESYEILLSEFISKSFYMEDLEPTITVSVSVSKSSEVYIKPIDITPSKSRSGRISTSPTKTVSPTPSPSISVSPSISLVIEEEIEKECITIATYNVREGIKNQVLMEIFTEYVQENKFDILALQELNGWSDDILGERAALWNHTYWTFLETDSGYHMGITSRLPFEVIRLRTEGFHHGMIHIRMLPGLETIPQDLLEINNFTDPFNDYSDDDELEDFTNISPAIDPSLHLIVSHLDPHSSTSRFEEAHHIDHQSAEHSRLLVLGDLNALSYNDAYYYNEIDLFDTIIADSRLTDKFLYHPLPGSEQYDIDYRVLDKFYNGIFQSIF